MDIEQADAQMSCGNERDKADGLNLVGTAIFYRPFALLSDHSR